MDIFSVSSMELDPQVIHSSLSCCVGTCAHLLDFVLLPQKLEDAADLTINTLELWLVAQKMFKLITASEKRIPRQLRLLLAHIQEEVHLALVVAHLAGVSNLQMNDMESGWREV